MVAAVQPDPLSHQAFPKICGRCGKTYHDQFQFFAETTAPAHVRSDTRVVPGRDAVPAPVYLEVYRNCACGSTLMEHFHSRRDLSQAGIRRREAFEQMLHILEGAGFSRSDARLMLLGLLDIFDPDRSSTPSQN